MAVPARERNKELWHLVATHPELAALDALTLIENLDFWTEGELISRILKGRKLTWKEELAEHCLHADVRDVPAAGHVIRALGPKRHLQFLARKVQEDPYLLVNLPKRGLLTEELLLLAPVRIVEDLGGPLQRNLLEVTRRELGEDTSAWEVFETLFGESERTYGEILGAAAALKQSS